MRIEGIIKPTTGNESIHRDTNDNGIKIVNVATHKNLIVKSMMSPYRNIHKYTWTTPDAKTHNQIDQILDVRSSRGPYCDTDYYLVVAKIKQRLAVSKQATQKFVVERFSLRKKNELEVRKQCQIKNSIRFTVSDNLNDSENTNRGWGNIKENIKTSA